MTQPMSHKVMASGDPSGTFTLYPAFLTPEEEYEYISTRMAELERQLGHQPNQHNVTKKKKKKAEKVKETKTKKPKDKKQKRADASVEASKATSKTKKVGKKGGKKKASKDDVQKEKEAQTMTDVSMSSCEMDSVQCVGKEKEPEQESAQEGKTAQEEAATNRSQQRLRKAASFLFNKTSDVKAYFRKMSADIREMATHPTPTIEVTPAAGEHQQAKTETKKSKLFKKRKSRRRSANDDQASSFGDDLNNMSSVEEDDTYNLTYDPRYTDAVFVLSSQSRNPHLGGPINASDYETFSIMIEEDSTTYDSPTILPAALPEVELDGELEEEELRSDSDSFASAPALKSAPPPRQLRVPVPVQYRPISTPPTVSLSSKASFRMSMPPVPPSAASKPHTEALRNHQPIEYLPYRSGWGARVVAPASSFSTRTYSCSSGTIPTTARRQTGTCIY